MKTTISILLFCWQAAASVPDWSENAVIPDGGRPNPYLLPSSRFEKVREAGRLHAQIYPVDVTGALPPYQALRQMLEGPEEGHAFREWLSQVIRGASRIESFDEVEAYLGLHPYPLETDQGVYSVPYPNGRRPETRMGMGILERHGAEGFTFSCAACHSSRLFGKTVLGMTNRFPRANELFVKAKQAFAVAPTPLFRAMTGASESEALLYRETRKNLQYIAVKKPLVLGLDTSLAQVALSLKLRHPGPWAEKDFVRTESDDWLNWNPADSKPAVWWNVKYKNRWLSDGSVLSGNPIFTNLLWNEIGRGVDLRDLSVWLAANEQKIQELTTAVFSSEAPHITDFFPAEMIDLNSARRGEKIFETSCSRCHGHYEKNWSVLPADAPLKEKLKTFKVRYPARTPVVDVGTDPWRRQGMKSLERLNELQISRDHGVTVKEQKGYVPPPLVGIWARWPYFHNNSVPSLCAVLTAGPRRPVMYWARPAENPALDFDPDCNGYPKALPEELKIKEFKYDTRRQGMGNRGHDERIFLKDGKELLSSQDKKDLIRYLQTL